MGWALIVAGSLCVTILLWQWTVPTIVFEHPAEPAYTSRERLQFQSKRLKYKKLGILPDLRDLSTGFLEPLAKVERFGPEVPTKRVIHLCDYHFVPFEDYAADLKSQDASISDEEIAADYKLHIKKVTHTQQRQILIINLAIVHYHLEEVWIEGVSDEDIEFLNKRIEFLREAQQQIADIEKRKDQLTQEELAEFQTLKEQQQIDLLKIGAAGRLMLLGKLKRILPLEDAETLENANPVRSDGTVKFDEQAMQARETAQAKRLLKYKYALIVLGEAHDLSDELEELSDGECEYLRVTVKELE